MKDYIFSNFNFSKEYKNKLIETVKKMSNLEIGGDRLYDGVGNHYMQNPHEIVDLIFALKKHETDNKINLGSFLEIGFAAGINNTFINKFFNFKNIVTVDYVQPSEINTNTFFANLRFKDLTLVCGDSTSSKTVKKVSTLGPYDFIFIDGGHEYEIVKKDFQNYSKTLNPKGLIAMHDIYSDICPGVTKFWNELKSGAKDTWQFEEFYDSNQKFKYGIGLIKIKNT